MSKSARSCCPRKELRLRRLQQARRFSDLLMLVPRPLQAQQGQLLLRTPTWCIVSSVDMHCAAGEWICAFCWLPLQLPVPHWILCVGAIWDSMLQLASLSGVAGLACLLSLTQEWYNVGLNLRLHSRRKCWHI